MASDAAAVASTLRNAPSNRGRPGPNLAGDDLLMFMSFPSARDPSSAKRFPNKSTACVITTAYPETFAQYYESDAADDKFRNQAGKRHNLEYDNLKVRRGRT